MDDLEESFEKAVKIRDAYDFSHLGGREEDNPSLIAARIPKRRREDISPNRRTNSLLDVETNPIQRTVQHYLNKNIDPLLRSGQFNRN